MNSKHKLNIKSCLALGVSLFIFSNIALADVYLSNTNNCDDAPGHWSGIASVSALGGFVKCKYKGAGVVEGTDSLNVYLNLERTSGSSVCQKNITYTLTGACTGDKIYFASDVANVSGYVINDGIDIIAKLNGKINAGGISADVQMDIIKDRKTQALSRPWYLY